MDQQIPQYHHTPGQSVRPPRRFAFLKLALAWAAAIGIAITLQAFVFQSYQVFGQSMEPTLDDGDYLIISKLGPTFSSLRGDSYAPERGEIVVVEPSDGPRLIKRVIGLPGEEVQVRGGSLVVYNDAHTQGFEPYNDIDLPESDVAGNIETDIPDNHIFVVGDNRDSGGSSDSRNQLGTIPTDNVVGSLVLRLWPLDEAQTF